MPYVVFFTTAGCNLRCDHCFYLDRIDGYKKESELTLNEIKKVSSKLGKIFYLSITGGEPLLRKDIIDVIRIFYKQNSVKMITFHSNGQNPERLEKITKEVLATCSKLKFIVSISLDGFEKQHDSIRGVKGSYKKVITSVERLQKFKRNPQFELNLNTVIIPKNRTVAIKLHNFILKTLGVSHDVTYLRGSVKDRDLLKGNLDTYKNLVRIMEKERLKTKFRDCFSLVSHSLYQICREVVIETEETHKMVYPCKTIQKAVVIDEMGDVLPCELIYFNKSLGNLKKADYDIHKILNTKKSKHMRKLIKKSKCSCSWECIIPLNTVFSVKGLFRLTGKIAKYYFRGLF